MPRVTLSSAPFSTPPPSLSTPGRGECREGAKVQQNGRLRDKVVIVTGAGRGIGKAIAIRCAQEGAHVMLASRTLASVDATVAAIAGFGGSAVGRRCDVGRRGDIFGTVAETAATFGRIDGLVNNAQAFGVPGAPAPAPVQTPLEDFDEQEWEYTFLTGATATFWAMKAAFPHLKQRGGKIVNFGSAGGQLGIAGMSAYNATKEAIRGLSRTAAREWGVHKINVNVINPGAQTDAVVNTYAQRSDEENERILATLPLRGYGLPGDIASLALFLLSDESSFITGQTINADSGLFLAP